jgi:hypothetical protein
MRLTNIILFSVFFSCLSILPGFGEEEGLGEAKSMKEQIQIINLINNLDLRKEQAEFILDKAKAADQIRNGALSEISNYESEMLKACSAIKEDVESGRVMVEDATARGFRSIKHKIEGVKKEARIKIDALAKGIEANLAEFQVIALDNYKPCIIPIVTKNRIGQSDAATGIIKVLEKVKRAPESKYAHNRDKLVKRISDKIRNNSYADFKIDEQEIKTEIINTFRKVRAMDNIDFQLQKEGIAEELHNRIFLPKEPMARTAKIRFFLLSKNVIPVLEKKLRQQN